MYKRVDGIIPHLKGFQNIHQHPKEQTCDGGDRCIFGPHCSSDESNAIDMASCVGETPKMKCTSEYQEWCAIPYIKQLKADKIVDKAKYDKLVIAAVESEHELNKALRQDQSIKANFIATNKARRDFEERTHKYTKLGHILSTKYVELDITYALDLVKDLGLTQSVTIMD